MGKNRKWVHENNLSEAVWRTISRGPRPPAATRRHPRSLQGSRSPKEMVEGLLPKDGQKEAAEERKVHHSLNPDEQLMAAQVRVAKLEAALLAIGEEDPAAVGLKEALTKVRIQAQVRPVQYRVAQTGSISGLVTEEVGVKLLKLTKPGWTSRRGMSIECLAIRSQGAIECFHCHQRSTRGDSSIAIEDCTDGSISGRRLHPGGDPDEETQDVGRFFPRFGASGRRRLRAGALMSNLTKPTCQ